MSIFVILLISLFLFLGVNGEDHYRNVLDFGAVGDGKTDCTQAFIDAITNGRGTDPNAKFPNNKYIDSTVHALQVFVPSGTYLITGSIPLVYYTQLVGDSSSLPILLVKSSSSVDLRVLDALEPSWSTSVNQNNFYRVVRNIIIDTQQCASCTAVHWQVAQATSLINVHFKMGPRGGKNQGVWMENGSGGYLSDCSFDGGLFALWVGTQQFTSRNVTIANATTAIYLNWDWNWSFKSLNIIDSPIGIDVGGGTGSLVVLDSIFTRVPIAIRTGFVAATYPVTNNLLLDNVKYVSPDGVGAIVVNAPNGGASTTPLPGPIGTTIVKQWAQGHIWKGTSNTVQTLDLSTTAPTRSESLIDASNGYFFEKMRPDYGKNPSLPIIDVSSFGVLGDGVTDVTLPLQDLLNKYSNNKGVLFFPHGIYLITDTVYVPSGSVLLGQAWSVLAATGSKFSNAKAPIPMMRVGKQGETGVAQLIDLLFSQKGPVPGAILLEWNMHDEAGSGNMGQAGMWDTHFRVGGAVGTDIRNTNCPAGDGQNATEAECMGAYMLMHVTKNASVYMENVWGWVADHDIDNGPQLNVYNARGFLCESQGPVWMYGTAMEHSALYQYNFNGASNVFLAMIQTETAYYQPSLTTPFASLLNEPSDPTFCTNDIRCNMSLALVIDNNSANIHIYGAGLYSFFNVWSQDCLKGSANKLPICQLDMVKFDAKSVYSYALNTYGSVYSLTSNEPWSKSEDGLSTFCSNVIVNLNTGSGSGRSDTSDNQIPTSITTPINTIAIA